SSSSYPEGSRMTLRPEPYAHLVNDRVFRGLAAFREHATKRGVTMAALAIAWVLSHPRTTAAILGPRKPEHLAPAAEALSIRLSEPERLELASLFLES
ncbi:MAG: aldo/keto reductase, partial [Vicinamibacteria bacterium]